MEIKNRLFPYPVLCGDTDDYNEKTEFAIEPQIKETVHDIRFNYSFVLNCNSLETLIRKGAAEYVLHIECSATAFRIALKSAVPSIEYRLQKSQVSGEVNIVAMIVAKLEINNYKSMDLNEDYEGESVSFKKGSILAYQNLPSVYVKKKKEDLANNESFFTVIKQTSLDPDEIRPLEFNLNKDMIQVLVDERTYEAFVRYQHSQSIAMAMLVLPAVSFMISEVCDNPEHFKQYQWFQRLDAFYRSQGMNFVDDVLRKDENPIMIAQDMLQNPISRAYRDLFALEDTK